MAELRHILLVEDDPYDLELIMTSLASNNIVNEVVAVRDGEEALDYFYRRGKFAGRTGGNPAVVLLDLKLPKVNGFEVLRQVKSDEALRCVPVVILTSSHEDQDIAAGYDLGANGYVVKPVDFNQFFDVIKETGVYWAIINETMPESYCKPR
ncbi:MAG: response regulator [Nitrospirae bacterium]|nr:response regulator [Nitrospirota bacterium]